MPIDKIASTKVDTVQITNIRHIVDAWGVQLQEVRDALASVSLLRNIDGCSGNQLDRIGSIICLTRHDAGILISDVKLVDDDEIYRILLKYKALLNTSACTTEDVIAGCKLIFNAISVSYSEIPSVPATFYVTITAKFSDAVLSLLQSHSIIVRPSGVSARISCSDTQYFGFADCDDASLGFGVGEFAQSIT